MNFITYWIPFLLWASFIFFSSSLPAKDIPALFPFQDIVFHFLAYACFAFLLGRAMNHSRIHTLVRPHKICLVIILSLLFAASDEFHQQFVPGRVCSGLDLFIDLIAVMFGASIYQW